MSALTRQQVLRLEVALVESLAEYSPAAQARLVELRRELEREVLFFGQSEGGAQHG